MGKTYDIVALGELLVDFTPAGISENGMLLFERNPGGAPVNMLTAAAKSGAKTAFIGKVGKDMHGLFLKDMTEGAGIDTSSLVLSEDAFTTLAFVELSNSGERNFSFARKPGADTRLAYKEIKEELLADTKVFHIGSLSLTDDPSRTTTFQAVRTAKALGAVISYDPNYRAPLWENRETAMERMRSMVQYVDIMKLSDEETGLLTPYTEPKEAAEYLLQKGVLLAAVTMGKNGVLVASGKGCEIVPAFQSKVVDTTGAGDSFWGAFVNRMLQMEEAPNEISMKQWRECALYGNAVASLCIERRGGMPSIPDAEEVEKRFRGMCVEAS